MTTIALKDGVMACDSKCTDEFGAFMTRTQKIYRLPNGALLGTAGDADARELMDVLGKATPKRLPTRGELSETHCGFSGILAFQNGQVFGVHVYMLDKGSDAEWAAQIVEIEERMTAVGSGQQFAIGAMAAGRSASEAVEIACRFDSYSQGPVKEVAVKSAKKAKAA
jgi:ATP-dependent protease HslVU (ClpYQ) peptidase subunit